MKSEELAGHSETNRKVDRILSYLENDDKTGRKGIPSEIESLKGRVQAIDDRLEEFIEGYNTKRAVKKGQIVLLSGIGAAGTMILQFLFKVLKGE